MPAVALPPQGKFQAFDVNGDPLTGGLLYTYQTGTSTNKATYTDATGNTANANPVVLDSRGEANVWILTDGNYRFKLHTAADALIWTVDGVGWANPTFEDATVTDDLTVGGDLAVTGAITGQWPQWLLFKQADETITITTGTAKLTQIFPAACTVLSVGASLVTASTSGLPQFDINEDGVSILSTKITIDANETSSLTALTPPVISDTAIASGASVTIDIDTAGTGAKGWSVFMKVRWAA